MGRAAHALFPGGVLVERGESGGDLVAKTSALIANPSIPAIFEATFNHEDVQVRVDVLERLGAESWGLREVKSSTSIKSDQHYPDLAIQKWVLEGRGLRIDSAELIHVNPAYVRGPSAINWESFFQRVELIDELSETIGLEIDTLRHLLTQRIAPLREPGSFCKKPHVCPFWESCTASKQVTWFVEQMSARAERKARMLDSIETGSPWFSEKLAAELAHCQPPVWALDFEAVVPAVPLFEGTRPYQALAFQWSLHRLSTDGEINHLEFLADGTGDPRPEVAASLLRILSNDDAPILVYSPYEKRCLKDLADLLPSLKADFDAIANRLVDMLPIVRGNFYHPDLRDSFSIKSVAPALAPQVSYDDLESISNGTAAMAAFEQIVQGLPTVEEERRLRADLLAYCERDTLALLEVYRALGRVSGFRW